MDAGHITTWQWCWTWTAFSHLLLTYIVKVSSICSCNKLTLCSTGEQSKTVTVPRVLWNNSWFWLRINLILKPRFVTPKTSRALNWLLVKAKARLWISYVAYYSASVAALTHRTNFTTLFFTLFMLSLKYTKTEMYWISHLCSYICTFAPNTKNPNVIVKSKWIWLLHFSAPCYDQLLNKCFQHKVHLELDISSYDRWCWDRTEKENRQIWQTKVAHCSFKEKKPFLFGFVEV